MERLYLNVFLLRKSATAKKAVSTSGLRSTLEVPIDQGNSARLYYGVTEGTPEWFDALANQSITRPHRKPKTSSLSGVLIARVGDKDLVATFGHAWQRINLSLVEPNFGLKCVLNLAEQASLKSIKRDRIADDFVQAIEQSPEATDIYRFGMDVEKDMLRGAKAAIDEKLDFGRTVAGTDSFKASIDISSESIGAFLRRCLSAYAKTDYKNKFGWVDNVMPVRDEALIGRLNENLAKTLKKSGKDLCLCVPDLLSWDDFDTFSFERKKRGHAPVAYELDAVAWAAYATGRGIAINAAALKDNFIYAYKQGEPHLYKKWSVLDCLHGSISYKASTYLAHGGQWFEINKDFVGEVEKRIAGLDTTFSLPATASLIEKEGDYNARVASGSSGALVLMDKNLVSHGGGRSRIEVCDLLSRSGELVCVKPWGGSSASLSHLFQQATVAAKLMAEDGIFRAKVRKKLPAAMQLIWDQVTANTANPVLVLAVLRGRPASKLPFFAKLSLAMCAADLRQMRFQPKYLVVP